MRPFIYNFLEQPNKEVIENLDLIDYSQELNLSVLKGTTIPAINMASMGTITFTKSDTEGSDSDNDKHLLTSYGTMTQTRQMIEGSDSDCSNAILKLMDTSSVTLVSYEASDSDKNSKISMMLSTRTLTEAKETTDSDR